MIVPHVVADLPLGINPWLLGAQLVNFGILYFILARFAFPALFKTLDQRAATIRQGVENAERAKAELARAQQQADGIVQAAQQRSQQIINDASVAGERVRAQIEAEAKNRAEEIAEQNRRRMTQEEAQAQNALRQQTADLAIQAASVVVGRSLDGQDQRRLVDQFLTEVQ
jgi:F-type H+-transporting ATPase subunit b